MIIFDQLRVSEDGMSLLISAHVNGASYFENVHIEKVTICTEDQVLNSGSYGDNYIYQLELAEEVRTIDLLINKSVLDSTTIITPSNVNLSHSGEPVASTVFSGTSFSNNMFFVFIECSAPAPDTPCTLDEATTIGVVFDYGVLYNRGMNYTRELADSCQIPSHFIDFILVMEAMKLSIATGNYQLAIEYWKQLARGFCGNLSTVTSIKPCGCHG